LTRIESAAFHESSVECILIPSTILFVASNAVDSNTRIRLFEGVPCPEFDRWWELNRSGIAVDFRRIERVGSGLLALRDYVVNLSAFEERSIIDESDGVRNEIYHRIEDQFLVVIKSIQLSERIAKSQIENEIGNLINVRHPCIAGPIGFVFPIESDIEQELKIIRLYSEGCSLAEILSVRPVWWTSTVKAKVVAGIVLGLRFVHSLGLLHGHLTANSIVVDSDRAIQIMDFHPILLEVSEDEEETRLGGFSGNGWTPERDLQAFASILFEIVVGPAAQGESSIPTTIPAFVSQIIERGLSPTSETKCSLNVICDILKHNNFLIEDGVDSAEVSAFVSWVESAEQSEK
jgi:serine/threonine protein kinase